LCPFVSLVFLALLWSIFFLLFFQISAQKATLGHKGEEKTHKNTSLGLLYSYSKFSLLFCV
jgi:hypothetical protein